MKNSFNINILNQGYKSQVISRGETKKTIVINEKDKGKIIIKKGTKGWLEWNGLELVFELDTPMKYPNWHGSVYRLIYRNESYKFKKYIKCYEATEEERIEYAINKINIKRRVRGLKEINPSVIRFNLNLALVNNLDLDKALQTYLDDIEIQVKSK